MKDPAVLFYINDWLTSTNEMDSDVRGWYLNLILNNYDKKDLPNDVEMLAVLCGVKFSEFERFKQVFEQVLKHKFQLKENGRLSNENTDKILRSREDFKDKRSGAGKVSYVMKYMAKNYNKEYKNITLRIFLKDNFDYSIDLKNEQMIKQVFEQVFELYINENEDENIDLNKDESKEDKLTFNFKKQLIEYGFEKQLVTDWLIVRKTKRASNTKTAFDNFIIEIEKTKKDKNELLKIIVGNSWQGFNSKWILGDKPTPPPFVETRLKK
jgi:uncharacterized protein YdaU (DUF1376 family)